MNKIELIFRDNMYDYINKIKVENPNAKFYSHSRLQTFNQCKRSYYYTYIDKKQQKTGVYSELGTGCHSDLEDLYEGVTDVLTPNNFNKSWKMCELFNISFPSSKYDIKGNYKKDILNCYKVYNKRDDNGKYISELGFILKIDKDHYIIGYIDLLILYEDGTCDIVDFKTSSDFDTKHTIEAGRQLILYKLAIEQLYGIKVNSVAWEMLKYVSVKVGENKLKTGVKGREWVNKCSSQIKTLMKKKGYDSSIIDMYLLQAISSNSIEKLPKEIQEQIKVDIYIRKYNVTDELIEEFWNHTKQTILNIELLTDDIINWGTSVDEFFCNNLCGFYPKHCNKLN